jgi:flagellar biosynthesis regulator FlaF
MDPISIKQITNDIALPILVCCLICLAVWEIANDSEYIRKVFAQTHRGVITVSKIILYILLALFATVIIFNVF